mmetsp:Transcript_55072/g.154567  ORF Transcript_55072/g.154567 Transcript_55072/m.154567 type:complete len:202 (-) Transcript_55072:989-1594(-)
MTFRPWTSCRRRVCGSPSLTASVRRRPPAVTFWRAPSLRPGRRGKAPSATQPRNLKICSRNTASTRTARSARGAWVGRSTCPPPSITTFSWQSCLAPSRSSNSFLCSGSVGTSPEAASVSIISTAGFKFGEASLRIGRARTSASFLSQRLPRHFRSFRLQLRLPVALDLQTVGCHCRGRPPRRSVRPLRPTRSGRGCHRNR